MLGTSFADLTASSVARPVLAYGWPGGVVIAASASARGRDATEALGNAIASLTADPRMGSSAPPRERAIVVGTQSAAMTDTVRFAREIHDVGAHLVNPALFPLTVMNATSGLAAIQHGCEGPNVTLCNGASSALDALVYAADLVVDGHAAVVFAGGFETEADADAPQQAAAVVCAVMTRDGAQRAGARPCAQLLATASGASVRGADAHRLASDLTNAATEAARPVGAYGAGRMAVVQIGTAGQALAALARAIDEGAGVTALVACRTNEPLGTVLVLASGALT